MVFNIFLSIYNFILSVYFVIVLVCCYFRVLVLRVPFLVNTNARRSFLKVDSRQWSILNQCLTSTLILGHLLIRRSIDSLKDYSFIMTVVCNDEIFMISNCNDYKFSNNFMEPFTVFGFSFIHHSTGL